MNRVKEFAPLTILFVIITFIYVVLVCQNSTIFASTNNTFTNAPTVVTGGTTDTSNTTGSTTNGSNTSNSTTNRTYAGYGLSAPGNTSFGSVTLDGLAQTVYTTLNNWTITADTQTADGWHVTLSSTPMTEVAPSGGFVNGTSALTLPQGSLTLTGTRTIVPTGQYTMSISNTGGPLFLNAGVAIDAGEPIEIVNASSGYGDGVYTVEEPSDGVALHLNPSTTRVDLENYPDSPTPYEADLMFSIVSGP